MTAWAKMAPSDIPEAVVKKALQMGADDVICACGVGETKQIRFANSSISASKSWASTGIGIYLAKDRRILTTDVALPSEIDDALDQLLKRVMMLEPNEEYAGVAQGKPGYRKRAADPKVAPMLEELYDYVDQAISSALEAGASRVAGVLYSGTSEHFQASSGGPSGSYSASSMEVSVRAMTDLESSGHMVQSTVGPKGFDPARVGREAGELAIESRRPEMGKAGKFDVVFSPMIFANILDQAGGSCSAGLVDAGMSFLAGKVGQEVAAKRFTLVDDATDAGSIGSPPFDEEGVPTGRNVLIDKGVLKGYLHNTSTAKRYGVKSTGNAGMVFPNPWSVQLEPGSGTRDRLISQVDSGYYMTNTWYTRFQNYLTGDFSTIPRDAIFRIEKGRLAGPVKDIRISESMANVLMNVAEVGNDPMMVHWWEVTTPVVSPHVLVSGVNITKSTQ